MIRRERSAVFMVCLVRFIVNRVGCRKRECMDLFKVTVTGYVDLCSNMLVRSTICAMVFMVTGIVLAQAPPCRTFIHGTFEEGTRTKQEIISGNKEGIRILRRGNSHVETNRATRHKVRYTVRYRW